MCIYICVYIYIYIYIYTCFQKGCKFYMHQIYRPISKFLNRCIYIYIYICVCVCVYIYIYIHIYIYIYIYIHTYIYIYMYIYTHTYTFIYLLTYLNFSHREIQWYSAYSFLTRVSKKASQGQRQLSSLGTPTSSSRSRLSWSFLREDEKGPRERGSKRAR